jgi:hypothetical protein
MGAYKITGYEDDKSKQTGYVKGNTLDSYYGDWLSIWNELSAKN